MAIGTTNTKSLQPSGRTYRSGDNSIDSRDLNFAIQGAKDAAKNRSVFARGRFQLRNWEAQQFGQGILIKTPKNACSMINSSFGSGVDHDEVFLITNDLAVWVDREEGDTEYAYIPYDENWFLGGTVVEGKEIEEINIYIHPVQDKPPNTFDKPQSIYESYLTRRTNRFSFSICSNVEHLSQVPQCDCYAQRMTKKLATLRMSKNNNGEMYIISVENHLVDQNIVFDARLDLFDIVSITPERDVKIYFPDNPWRPINGITGRYIRGTVYQQSEKPLPNRTNLGHINNVYTIDGQDMATGRTVYFKFEHGLTGPEEVSIVFFDSNIDDMESYQYYTLFQIDFTTLPDIPNASRVDRYNKIFKGELLYLINPITYDEEGNSEIPVFPESEYKYLRFRGVAFGSQRSLPVLDWIRANNDPLELEPPEDP